MGERMGGWMNGRMNGWIDGWMDARMNGWSISSTCNQKLSAYSG